MSTSDSGAGDVLRELGMEPDQEHEALRELGMEPDGGDVEHDALRELGMDREHWLGIDLEREQPEVLRELGVESRTDGGDVEAILAEVEGAR